MWNFNKQLKNLKSLDKDDLLDYIGLQSRPSAMESFVPVMAAFGVGVLLGAGLGLMLAPKSGAELRDDLKSRIQGGPDQMAGTFPAATSSSERAPKVY
jgi:hypothetical protein